MRFQPSAYSGDAASFTVSASAPTTPSTSTASAPSTSGAGFKVAPTAGAVSGKVGKPKLGLAYTDPHYDSAGNYWRWDESRQLWVSVTGGRESTKPDPNRISAEEKAQLAAIQAEQQRYAEEYRACVARGECVEPGPRTLSPVDTSVPEVVEAEGLSMTTKILIGVGVLAVAGFGVYYATR